MKAVVHDRFVGPEVVHLADLPRPEPGPGDLLIRVQAAAVTTGDCRIRAQNMPRGFGLIMRLIFGFRFSKAILYGAPSGRVCAVTAGLSALWPKKPSRRWRSCGN